MQNQINSVVSSTIASVIDALIPSKLEIKVSRVLVVIDAGVDDRDFLVKGVLHDADVMLLDWHRDGIAQIGEMLRTSDFTALQIVAHGCEGELQLGNTSLNLSNLLNYATALRSWQVDEISLYACEVASGATGRDFVKQLAVVTGARVAAATTKVGNRAKGGTWNLAVQTGAIAKSLMIENDVLTNYAGILPAVITFSDFPETIFLIKTVNSTALTYIANNLNQVAAYGNQSDGLWIRGGSVGTNIFNVNGMANDFSLDLLLTGSGYTNGDVVNFNVNPRSNDLYVDLVQTINVASSVGINTNDSTDTGDVAWTAGQTVVFNSGSSLTTTTGNTSGDIVIRANGGLTAVNAIGVNLNSASITSADGAIAVLGNGSGTTGSNNYGVVIQGANSQISSVNGAIAVVGSGGNGTANHGVLLVGTGKITTTGTGEIVVSGTGGGTAGDGIRIDGSGSRIQSNSGAINLIGAGSGTGVGINIVNSGAITSTTGNIRLQTDTLNIAGGANSIGSNGNLAITQKTNGTTIGIGDGTTGTLHLSNLEISRLRDGFASIAIGDSNSGAVNINSVFFTDSLVVSSGATLAVDLVTVAGGNASFIGNIINFGGVTASGSVSLLANNINFNGSISSPNNSVFINQDNDTTVGVADFGTSSSISASNLFLNDTIKVDYNSSVSRFDTLTLTGALDLAGSTLQLNPTNYTTPTENAVFTIINNDGTDAVTGTFTGLAEGAQVATVGNFGLYITYKGNAANPTFANIGSGNDVQIYVKRLIINNSPTNLAISASAINENVAANSVVGNFSSTDPDVNNTFTYSLVEGTGDTDNAAFSISGNQLRINASPDFEIKSSYSVRVRTTDQGGLSFEKQIAITINDLPDTNFSPTDLALSANTLNENVVANTVVGNFSSTDANSGNTFTYSLVTGTGDTDNAAFSISGYQLTINASPDFETKSSYSVRVRTTDQGGLSFEKQFAVTILDLPENTFNFSTSAETITISANGANTAVGSNLVTAVNFDNSPAGLAVNGGTGGTNTFNVNGVGTSFGVDLSLTGSGYGNGDVVNLNANPHSNDFTIDKVQQFNVAGSLALTILDTPDQGDVNWTAGQDIVLNAGSSLTTTTGNATGNINLIANGQTMGINHQGIWAYSSTISSTDGTISLNGISGNAGDSNDGVRIEGTGGISTVSSVNGAISLIGQGRGASLNRGVLIYNNALLTSSTGNITVNGSSLGTATENFGIWLRDTGVISSTGTGANAAKITLTGQGSTAGAGIGNLGIRLQNNGKIQSIDGAIAVTGAGGGTSAANSNLGVQLTGAGSQIVSTGTGAVNVTGIGGLLGTFFNHGVQIETGTTISSAIGNVTVEGTGNGTSSDNYGVRLFNGGTIAATGTGTVTVTGKGSIGSAAHQNYGVLLEGTDSKISSNSGAIAVTGIGGGASSTFRNYGVVITGTNAAITSASGNVTVAGTANGSAGSENYGIFLTDGGAISSAGTGTVTVTGQGSLTSNSNDNDGIRLSGTNSKISSVDGAIAVTGTGGGNGSAANRGILIQSNALITSTTGNITVNGTGNLGGTGTNFNFGLQLYNGGQITSSGNVNVTGTAKGTGSNNWGIYLVNDGGGAAIIAATGTGTVTVTGQGSINGTGNDNDGIRLEGTNTQISSVNGAIAVTGTGGGTGAANLGIRAINGAKIQSTGTATITVNGTGSSNGNGVNYGVQVANSAIASVTGNINVTGTGNGFGNTNRGISIENSGVVSSTGTGTTAATITLTGQGSTAGNDNNRGILLIDGGSQITSVDGAISLTGTGGGTGNENIGVDVEQAAVVESTGTATITVKGDGSSNGSNSNFGIFLAGNNATIRSVTGDVTLTGTGQGSGSNNHGVYLQNVGKLQSTDTAKLIVTGLGSTTATGANNSGVRIEDGGSQITSVNGAIAITGNAGSGTDTNIGVHLFNGGQISSTGTGANAASITVIGQGSSNTTGIGNDGIRTDNANSISSIDGAISLTGIAGKGSQQNRGVVVYNGGLITSATGNITVNGTGGNTGFANYAMWLYNSNISSTGTGANAAQINITGQGANTGTGNDNNGIRIEVGSQISSIAGVIAVTGTGGNGTDSNYGVVVYDSALITSATGNITVNGTGHGTASNNYGVWLLSNGANSGVISSTETATVTVTGQGSNNGTSDNTGVRIEGTGSQISSVNGAIAVTGTGGTGTESNHGVQLLSTGAIVATGTAAITVTGTGGGTAGDGIRIDGSGSKIQSNSGAINLTGTGSGTGLGINLINGGAISSTTGNINLHFNTINLADSTSITTAGNLFINQDNDVNVGTTILGATVNITAGNLFLNDTIKIDYNSSQSIFDTINLTGAVDLVGSTLNLDLTNYITPAVNTFYTLINNDGNDAVTGTFTGLAEGTQLSSIGSYGLFITYKGDATNPSLANVGSGNDVQLYTRLINTPPTGVALSNTVISTLVENTSTATRIKVADIAIVDDAVGINELTVTGTDATYFEVSGGSLYLKEGVVLDYETKTSYNINLAVSDPEVSITPANTAYSLSISDINEVPTVTSGASTNFVENGTGTFYTVTGTDPDAGTTLTYGISGTDAALFNINSSTGAVTFKNSPNFEVPTDSGAKNVYEIDVIASDGSLTNTKALAITVTNINEAPSGLAPNRIGVIKAPLQESQEVAAIPVVDTAATGQFNATLNGNTLTIQGLFSNLTSALRDTSATGVDSEGNPIDSIHIHSAAAGVNGSIIRALTVTADANQLGGTFNGVFTLSDAQVTLAKNNGLYVNIHTLNNPSGELRGQIVLDTMPIAENTTEVTTVTAIDPEGDALTYSLSGGADQTLFAINATTGALSFVTAPNFEAPTDAGANNIFNVQVQVTDGTNPVITRDLTVTVTDVNEAPSVTSGATANFAENGTATAYTVTATDPDASTTFSYSISGTDAALFDINSSTGVIAFKNAPNFELPTDSGANNVYEIDVIASDGSLTNTKALVITVTNVNEVPTVTSDVSTNFVENGTGTVYTVTGTDPDAGTTLTYGISGTDAALFDINSSTGAVTFKTAPNFEVPTDSGANNVYEIDVIVSDGSLTNTKALTINVTNVNEFAVTTPIDSNAATNAIAENATNVSTVGITANATDADGSNNTVTYTLADNAGGRFAIGANTGVVSVANETLLNFETATSHNITVQASSSDGSTSTQTFAIAITDVNELAVTAPTDSNAATNAIAENAINGSTVGITASATDADGSNNTVTYALTDNAGGRFAIDANTGVVTIANGNLLNFETATSHNITVQASSSDGSTSTQTFAIAVTNINEAPTVTSGASTNFAENGTGTAYTATATDPDAATTFSYSISGTDAALFDINSSTGNVTFKTAPNFEVPIDNGVNNLYDINVIASDGLLGNTKAVAITVTDVNESPTVTNAIADQKVKQGEAFNFIFPANTFNDVDAGDIINYQATLENGAALPNWLSFTPTTTAFTGTPSNSEVGNLNIKVIATDKENLSVSDVFALQIENVNDAPTVANSIADQTAIEDKDFSFTFDPNIFSDIDKEDILTYSVALKNGNELPAWLKFNAIDRTFSGKPTKSDLGSLEIVVLAKDKAGAIVTDTFLLNVDAQLGIKISGANGDIFKISNSNGGDAKLKVTLNSQGSSVVNELGMFTVDDEQGRINGIAPDAPGYTQAALERSKVIFAAIANPPSGFNTDGLSSILKLNSDSNVRFYLVRNGSTEGVKSGSVPLSNLLFSDPLKQKAAQTEPGKIVLSWKDPNINSANFQDLVVTIQSTDEEAAIGTNLQGNPEGEVIDLRTATQPLTATFTVNREASFNNFVGFYRIADEKGGIDTNGDGIADVLVGQSGYIQAAINRRVEGINLTVTNQGTASYTGTFQPGSIFAPFVLANGGIEALLDSNPNNNPEVYFPFLGSNSDKQDHIRMLGNNVFGFEDLPNGGDNDFNDIIIRVNLRQ